MAKKMVYFNATKEIETITIHYNNKLDGKFVDDVARNIKQIAAKMNGVDLKNPREFYDIQVYVYPSMQLFNKLFGGEIEKRFYNRKRTLEDLYVVKDSEGNIHVVSPRGMNQEKRDTMKKIMVMNILGEYMDDKQKKMADKLLKASLKPKVEQELEEKEEPEEEELESIAEQELEEVQEEYLEVEQEELTEQEFEELLFVQNEIEEELEENVETKNVQDDTEKDIDEQGEEECQVEETLPMAKTEAQQWLDVGWLAYVRGKLKKENDIKKFAEYISKNGVKKLGKLSKTRLLEQYNYSEEYACAIVEYVIDKYGTKKFVEFYKNPQNTEEVLGITNQRFNSNVKAYIYSKYSAQEMLMSMNETGVNDITEIHFEKTGGADIVKSNEINEKTI